MNGELKILQYKVCINNETLENYLILLFMSNEIIIGISIIKYPGWFKFWDEKFQYYQFCYN
jgi:hypothetical protein